MTSLRRIFLCSILSITAITLLIAALLSYHVVRRDINKIFDAQLFEMSHNMQRFNEHYGVEKISNANYLNDTILLEYPLSIEETRHQYESKRVYQIWNTDGHLVVRDNFSPVFPISNMQAGFEKTKMGKIDWYTHTLIDNDTGLIYVSGQRGDVRQALIKQLALHDMIPFLLLFPVLGISIWIIIGHGIKRAKLVSEQLDNRAYDNLNPLPLDNIPEEHVPIIKAVNDLFYRLNQAYERERRFTADAAHELRTPLAASKTMVQLAMNAKSVKDCKTILEDAENGVNRCTHVVKQLAILSSLKPEMIVNVKENIKLGAATQQIVSELKTMATENNTALIIKIQENLELNTNLACVQILLRNIIDNAIRYSPACSEVLINASQENDYVHLKIIDNGPGIPKEMRKRVFERFYRSIDSKEEGSGLGLSIVAEICTLLQAQICLSEGPGDVGLCVCIKFPITS